MLSSRIIRQCFILQRGNLSIQIRSSSSVDSHVESKKLAHKDNLHIDRQSYEYTASGTDDAIGGEQQLSYDHTVSNDPEEAVKLAGNLGQKYNPLEVSAANPKVSTVGSQGEFTVERKETITYLGKSSRKQDPPALVPKNRTYAGTDTRKPQSPRDIAEQRRTIVPGSR